MSLAPTVPILLPLIGACLLLTMPARWNGRRLGRYLYVGTLIGTFCALLALAMGDVSVGILTLNSPFPMSIRTLRLVWDGLTLQFAMLPILGLALQAALTRDTLRLRAGKVAILVAASALVAGCAAADLLSLCVCWGLMDAALIVDDLLQADETKVPLHQQHIWARALALLCLTVAAMLLVFDQGRTEWAYAALDHNVQSLIIVAAWLRLAAFPLPGGLGVMPTHHLIALCTGGYLWLRLGSVAIIKSGQPFLVFLATVGLAALSLTALLAQDDDRRIEAVHLHGVTMLLLAPLLDPLTGFGVATLLAIGLGIVLVMQIGWTTRPPKAYLGRWQTACWLVALGSLAGLPLTLGWVVHWHFMRIAYLTGQRGVLVVSSCSFVLMAIACWRSGRRLWGTLPERNVNREQDGRTSWRTLASVVSLGSMALYLVLTGIYPNGAEQLWPTGFAGLDVPGIRASFAGPSDMFMVVLAMGLLLPLAGIWITERYAQVKIFWYRGPLRAMLGQLLGLDWFYQGLRQGLAVLQAALRRLARVLEESFVLGWSIFWALVFVIYTLRTL